jgi:hypothetical protein
MEPVLIFDTRKLKQSKGLEGPHVIAFRLAAALEDDILPRLLGQGLYGYSRRRFCRSREVYD